MARAVKDILEDAMGLPEKERIQVVEGLLGSLEQECDEDADSVWAAEIERRSLEIKEGTVRLLPGGVKWGSA